VIARRSTAAVRAGIVDGGPRSWYGVPGMKSSSTRLLVGLVLLVAGAAVFVYGIVNYENDHASLGGAIRRALTGSSPRQQEGVLEMIGGGAAAVAGLLLAAMRRTGRKRR
jgi:hypothetical protein